MIPIIWQAHFEPNDDTAAYLAISEQQWPGYPPPPIDPKWWRTPFARIVGKNEDDEVVGGCEWLRREIEVGDQKHVIAALGGVVMAPWTRGKGLGGRMIPFANSFVASEGYDWAVLFTGHERRRFYGAAGYAELEGDIYVTKFDVREKIVDEGTVVMAAPLNEKAAAQWPNWQGATIDVGHGTW
ncbi:GNAT family N-acetyltransferase [bacterium]|nr:MAG: GNAT family N-acetyltransferase [bacterium]